MRHAAVLALLLFATAAPASADGPADEAAIRKLVADNLASTRGGPAFTPNIHADVMFTNIFGAVFRGRAEYVDRHRYLGTVLFKGATVERGEVLRVFFVRPDVALVLIEWVIAGITNFPPGPALTAEGTLRTRGLNVMTKENGQWVTAAWHNTDVKAGTP